MTHDEQWDEIFDSLGREAVRIWKQFHLAKEKSGYSVTPHTESFVPMIRAVEKKQQSAIRAWADGEDALIWKLANG